MEFVCTHCGRKHERKEEPVDEYIRCACGYEFYAFYDHGMTVTMPSAEVGRPGTAELLRRFVVGTGRCADVRVEPVSAERFLRTADPRFLLEIGLERYQAALLGRLMLNCGDIAAMCECLGKGRDLMIRNKGDYVDIIELKRKQRGKEETISPAGLVTYLKDEYGLRDWQREIMEQDAGRTGILSGETV